jgi:predicted SAM-dependent methyltransferase
VPERSVPLLARWRWRLQRGSLIRAYLATAETPKLHLGSGTNPLEGWLNTDLRPGRPGTVLLDARERFPLPDRAFDFVFAEHMIEHLSLADGIACLQECLRVLRPGGRIRVATPSLERLTALFAADQNDEQRQYVAWATDRFLPQLGVYEPGFVLNNFFRSWGHSFIYDPRTLAYALERAGFEEPRELEPGRSESPELAGLEGHGRLIGSEPNAFETIVLEARRPNAGA